MNGGATWMSVGNKFTSKQMQSNVVIFYGEAHVIYAGVEGRIEK